MNFVRNKIDSLESSTEGAIQGLIKEKKSIASVYGRLKSILRRNTQQDTSSDERAMDGIVSKIFQSTDNQVERLTRFQTGLLSTSDDDLSDSSTENVFNRRVPQNDYAPNPQMQQQQEVAQALPKTVSTSKVDMNNLPGMFNKPNKTEMNKSVEELISEAEKNLPEITKLGMTEFLSNGPMNRSLSMNRMMTLPSDSMGNVGNISRIN